MMRFAGKLALQQRVLPNYRAPFFDLLASACDGDLSLFTGLPRPVEGIATTDKLQVARYHPGKNIHLFQGSFYLCYQSGLIDWLKNWNPDALIVEANPRYLSTPAAVRWMHRRNRPVIGWGLGAPPLLLPSPKFAEFGGGSGGGWGLDFGKHVVFPSSSSSTRCSRTVSAARTSMPRLVSRAKRFLWRIIPCLRRPALHPLPNP